MMPPRGAEARAESVATVQRISHDMFVSDETGRLIERAAAQLDGAPAESDDGVSGAGHPAPVGEGAAGAE